jgi:hypothetical protein
MATATIEEELAVVSESPEEQLKRIYNCLKLTERRLPQGSDVWIPESDDEIRLCGVRLVALQHRDRLSTAIELCNGYEWFDVNHVSVSGSSSFRKHESLATLRLSVWCAGASSNKFTQACGMPTSGTFLRTLLYLGTYCR